MKQIFLLAFLSSLSFMGHAQSTISDAVVRITPQNHTSLFDGEFTIEITDTISPTSIELKLGTDDGLADLASYAFSYDVTTGLPAGYSYARQKNKCILNVGTIALSNAYYGEVRILSNGNWSSPYKFIGN